MDNLTGNHDRFLDRLQYAFIEADQVPSAVIEFAGALFTWRHLDADLAKLSFDSVEQEVPSGVRSTAIARMVSFRSGRWVLDLEFDPVSGQLMGRVMPEAKVSVELHSGGARSLVESDEFGRFEFAPVETGPISLVMRFEGGDVLKTSWVFL